MIIFLAISILKQNEQLSTVVGVLFTGWIFLLCHCMRYGNTNVCRYKWGISFLPLSVDRKKFPKKQ